MRKSLFAAIALWLIISLVIGLVLFALSLYLFPEWKSSSRNLFVLAGAILVPLMRLMGPVSTWVIEHKKDRERKERSQWAFRRETEHSVRLLKPSLRGIPEFIDREEADEVLEQLGLGRPVLLTGEAGTGKSGIAVALVSGLADQEVRPLLIDARRLAAASNSAAITEHFELSEPLVSAIRRQAGEAGMRVVMDQVDTMVTSDGIGAIMDLLIDCSDLAGVEVVAISRRKVAKEVSALRPLIDAGFQEIVCRPLRAEVVTEVLAKRGLSSPSPELLSLGENLLNLEIICEIIAEAGEDSLDDFEYEINLWERYRRVIQEREYRNPTLEGQGDELLAEAVRLAILGLSSPDKSFQISFPHNPYQARLISSNVIVQDSGRTYRFQHEKLQDYLYAWDAAERNLMPDDVYGEIGNAHARNVLVWMSDRYQHLGAPQYGPFLEELLSG